MEEVKGEMGLDYIRYKNRITGEITEYHAKEGENFGVFVFVGYAPETDLVKNIAELNEQGYVITDKSQKTSVDGLYAAGDICIKPLRQVVTATSDGALAATELEKYVLKVQNRTGLRTQESIIREKALGGKATEKVSGEDHKIPSDGLFTMEMRKQLEIIFERMESPLVMMILKCFHLKTNW